jgi:hypothetical protein
MAATAKMTVRVTSTRGGSNVSFSSAGTYISTQVNGYRVDLTGQPVQPTADQKTFWASVLAIVQAQSAANPSP